MKIAVGEKLQILFCLYMTCSYFIICIMICFLAVDGKCSVPQFKILLMNNVRLARIIVLHLSKFGFPNLLKTFSFAAQDVEGHVCWHGELQPVRHQEQGEGNQGVLWSHDEPAGGSPPGHNTTHLPVW